MNSRITRRRLLAFLGTTAASLGFAGLFQPSEIVPLPGDKYVYLPKVQKDPSPSPTATETTPATGVPSATPITPTGTPEAAAARVVHVHGPSAIGWDFSSGWYGDYVDQNHVDAMVDHGVMALTGAVTRADAWRAILPSYRAGQKIAIKINLNNASCNDHDNVIDALPQPINSIIAGLRTIGVAENDIWVYDVTNGWHSGDMPARLVNKVAQLFPGVQFHSNNGACSTALGFSSSEKIHFGLPLGKPAISDRPICNALVNATYLINMPIMKKHEMAGVTLSFKNHFGSFDHCDYVHWSTTLGDSAYTSAYNALVDIYKNPHFRNKTVLTVADSLYGARINNYTETPSPWSTFGNQAPSSLFFSRDPVAVDCVMCDFLQAEGGIPAHADDYLKLASAAGLGVFERGEPWGAGYHQIDYSKIEI